MVETLSMHARFIEHFNALVAEREPRLENPDLLDKLAEQGIEWSIQKLRRVRRQETKELSLDEYLALSRIVGRTLEEVTDSDIDRDSLVRIQGESFKDLIAGMRRAYLAAFDILNARTRFLSTSRRLREMHDYQGGPDHLAEWAEALAQLDGKFYGEFVRAFVAAETGAEEADASKPERAWQVDEWKAARAAESRSALDKLLSET